MSWNRIARRIRVPLGFVFAVLFLWLARPTLLFMVVSLAVVVPGLLLRGYQRPGGGHRKRCKKRATAHSSLL